MKAWPAVLTWRSPACTQMESTRVQLVRNRIKAHGRIVAAATPERPAFSVSYDLVTDDSGAFFDRDLSERNSSNR